MSNIMRIRRGQLYPLDDGDLQTNEYMDELVDLINSYIDELSNFDRMTNSAITLYNNSLTEENLRKKYDELTNSGAIQGKSFEEYLSEESQNIAKTLKNEINNRFRIFEEKVTDVIGHLKDIKLKYEEELALEQENLKKEKLKCAIERIDMYMYEIKNDLLARKNKFGILSPNEEINERPNHLEENDLESENSNEQETQVQENEEPTEITTNEYELPKGRIRNVNRKKISKLGVGVVILATGAMVAIPMVGVGLGVALSTGFGMAATYGGVGAVMGAVGGCVTLPIGVEIFKKSLEISEEESEKLRTAYYINKLELKKQRRYIKKVTSDLSKVTKKKKNRVNIETLEEAKEKCIERIILLDREIKKIELLIKRDYWQSQKTPWDLELKIKLIALEELENLLEEINIRIEEKTPQQDSYEEEQDVLEQVPAQPEAAPQPESVISQTSTESEASPSQEEQINQNQESQPIEPEYNQAVEKLYYDIKNLDLDESTLNNQLQKCEEQIREFENEGKCNFKNNPYHFKIAIERRLKDFNQIDNKKNLNQRDNEEDFNQKNNIM